MPQIDPLLSLAFAMHANRGTQAVLLGSGVSRAAGIPTGWQVVLDLVARLAEAMGEDTGADVVAWYVGKFGKQPDYSDLLDALVKTPDQRRGLLHSYFEPTAEEREQGLKQPTAAHRAIARLVEAGHIRVILTTNFDHLMETALRDLGIEPVMISSPDGIAGAPPLSHWRGVIVKLHGDYLDTRIRNTEEELATYDPALDHLLDRILDEFGLIISGWSGEWDTALRAALERCPTRRFSSLWADPGTMKPKARELATLRAIEVMDGIDADRLFTRLEESLTSLSEIAERRHPLTPTLAVATAKRWLSEPEKNRIRLHDMVMDEVDRVIAACSPEHFPIQGVGENKETLNNRLRRYEAATETLCSLLIIFIHWGDTSHLGLWTKAVEQLDGREMAQNGSALWFNFQRYPTLLVLYAGGIAAAGLGRYEWMRALLADPIGQVNGKRHPIGRRLDAANLLGQPLKALPEYEKRHTPGSDYLLSLLQKWLKEILPSQDSYLRAFDRFEYLFALWRLSTNAGYIRGCFAWRDGSGLQAEIETEIRTSLERWPPITSGLFPRDASAALAAKKTLDEAINQLGWRW